MQIEEKKRRFFRKELETNITFECDGETRDCLTNTISAGGLYVQTILPPPIGTLVEVTFSLPTGNPICALAQVRHVLERDAGDVPAGFGIEFTRIEEDDRLRIVEFVESEGNAY